MKYAHPVVALLFALFAYWQLNDPDWPAWVAMYGSVALVAAWRTFGGAPKALIYVALIATAGWMLTLVPDLIAWIGEGTPNIAGQMKAETPYIELTREFFGLLISAVTLALYARL